MQPGKRGSTKGVGARKALEALEHAAFAEALDQTRDGSRTLPDFAWHERLGAQACVGSHRSTSPCPARLWRFALLGPEPLALALLGAFDGGIAAPSANRYGRVSPTSAAHVREELGDAVDLMLNGGPCHVGIESTIMDLTSSRVRILRPGAVTAQAMGRVLEAPVLTLRPGVAARVPGCKASHYAPRARVVRVSLERAAQTVERWRASGHRVGLLASRRWPECLPMSPG